MDKQAILMKASVIATAMLISLTATWLALAGSLYDAPPSPTSAFVRFIEAEGRGVERGDLVWRKQEVPFSKFAEGQYIPVESALIGSQPGDHMTIAFLSDGPVLEFNEVAREKGKVALQLLNMSASPVELKTADGKISILENVDANGLEARQINPLSFAVMVEADGEFLGVLDLNIKRSDNPVIVVRPDRSLTLINSSLNGSNNQ